MRLVFDSFFFPLSSLHDDCSMRATSVFLSTFYHLVPVKTIPTLQTLRVWVWYVLDYSISKYQATRHMGHKVVKYYCRLPSPQCKEQTNIYRNGHENRCSLTVSKSVLNFYCSSLDFFLLVLNTQFGDMGHMGIVLNIRLCWVVLVYWIRNKISTFHTSWPLQL